MKNNIVKLTLLIVLISAVIGIAVGQGLYWESITKVPMANGKDINSISCYRAKMFKQSSDNSSSIFRLDKKLIYLIDNQNKEYSEMTFAEFEASAKKANKQLEGKMAEMNEQLKKMPPEQRKAMEKIMGSVGMGGQSKKIEVTKTGEKKTISGFSCVKYSIKEDGKEIGVLWTTTSVPDFSKMQNDMKEFSQRMAAQMPRAKDMVDVFGKVEGFPVETTIAGITTTVTKVEKKDIAASEFEVPSGYKKVPPKGMATE